MRAGRQRDAAAAATAAAAGDSGDAARGGGRPGRRARTRPAHLLLVAREDLDLVLRALVEEHADHRPHDAGHHRRRVHDHERAEDLRVVVLVHLADALDEGHELAAELHQPEAVEVDDAEHRADAPEPARELVVRAAARRGRGGGLPAPRVGARARLEAHAREALHLAHVEAQHVLGAQGRLRRGPSGVSRPAARGSGRRAPRGARTLMPAMFSFPSCSTYTGRPRRSVLK